MHSILARLSRLIETWQMELCRQGIHWYPYKEFNPPQERYLEPGIKSYVRHCYSCRHEVIQEE